MKVGRRLPANGWLADLRAPSSQPLSSYSKWFMACDSNQNYLSKFLVRQKYANTVFCLPFHCA
jgi:hypothetical protein